MTNFSRHIALAACLLAVASSAARADAADDQTLATLKQEVSARYDGHADALKDYVAVNLTGVKGHAYRLADNAARADNNQPAVLIFDDSVHVVAIAYARPSAGRVTVMSLQDFSVRTVEVSTSVATR